MFYQEEVEDNTIKNEIKHYVDNPKGKWYSNVEEIVYNMRKINCPDILILKFLRQLNKEII